MLEEIKKSIENGEALYMVEQTFNLKSYEMDAILDELDL
mgnify:CR=1 FL=1